MRMCIRICANDPPKVSALLSARCLTMCQLVCVCVCVLVCLHRVCAHFTSSHTSKDIRLAPPNCMHTKRVCNGVRLMRAPAMLHIFHVSSGVLAAFLPVFRRNRKLFDCGSPPHRTEGCENVRKSTRAHCITYCYVIIRCSELYEYPRFDWRVCDVCIVRC